MKICKVLVEVNFIIVICHLDELLGTEGESGGPL
jgi:hypothetical protein